MTTRFRGLSIRDLQDLHANAPTTIIAYDEHGSPAYTSGPCFGFYKAVHTALPDLLSAVGVLGAALDAAEAENERLRKIEAAYRDVVPFLAAHGLLEVVEDEPTA